MIFDVETYFAPDFELADARGLELLQSQLDEAEVDHAVLFPLPKQLDTDNAGLRNIIAHDSRFIAVASMNPNLGEAALKEFRQAITEWGFRGLKLMPVHCISFLQKPFPVLAPPLTTQENNHALFLTSQ